MGTGNVQITINDGGTGVVVLPGSNVQVVIGCSSTGTVNVPVATRSPMTLQQTFGYGPLVEAASMACAAGGVVIAIKATTNAVGSQNAVVFSGTGTSTVTTSGNAYDDYFIEFEVISGGTIGTGPISFQVSLDAGRNPGPVLSLGTATSYAIPNTGVTLNFGVGTLVTGDIVRVSTFGPTWNTAGIQSALTALLASSYAATGWGSMHVVSGLAGCSGANAQTINGYLDTAAAPAFATNYVYTRSFLSARDVKTPTAWGGTAETESAWMTALGSDYSTISAKRVCVGAGNYNMPSALGVGLGQGGSAVGIPSYRRPLAWAAAARQILVPPQRLISRVRDGSLAQIVQNPLTDPTDGFVYHDERINPGLDYLFAGVGSNRFMAACTRIPSLPGFYITDPLLASPLGSQFTLMPLGLVMDEACDIVHQQGQLEINEDVRLNPNGTIFVNDAVTIQNEIGSAIDSNLFATNQISEPASVVVDQTVDIESTGIVPITVTITPRGYILEEVVNIQYS